MLLGDNHAQAIYVDKDQQQLLYLQREEEWNCKQGFPVTLGVNSAPKQKEGDKATPEGIYTINQRIYNQNARFGPARLILNYPNRLDKQKGRTGNGIIITATSFEAYTKGLKEKRNVTNGSIVLYKKHLQTLEKSLAGNTYGIPVIIEDSGRLL